MSHYCFPLSNVPLSKLKADLTLTKLDLKFEHNGWPFKGRVLSSVFITTWTVSVCGFEDWPLFHVYSSAHSEPTDKASSLLCWTLLIESQRCSLWLAFVPAFKSLLIPTALSARIKYPLILHRRPFNWDFSHLACLSEHQRHQRWHDLSKRERTSVSLTDVHATLQIPVTRFPCHLFIDLLWMFNFPCLRPLHALVEAWRWTPLLLHNCV